jgi:hypothetical protein
MSESAEEEKYSIPLCNIENALAVVTSIRAKGGACTLDVLVTSMGKSESMAQFGLRACTEFKLVETDGKQYKLTDMGSRLASSTEQEQRKLVRELVLHYEPYNTVLLRIQNAKDKTIQKSDITKAWYDLQRSGTDRTREQYTSAFASIASWCGLVDSRKDAVALIGSLEPGVPLVLPSRTERIPASMTSQPAAPGPHAVSPPMTPATVSIQISVDVKDDESVRNVLRIIKTLRGESAD